MIAYLDGEVAEKAANRVVLAVNGVGYDVLFYNLLVVNGSNFPRVVTLTQQQVQAAGVHGAGKHVGRVADGSREGFRDTETFLYLKTRKQTYTWGTR